MCNGPVKTLFATREDSRARLVARLFKIAKALQLSGEELRQVSERVMIVDLVESPVRVSKVDGDVVVPDMTVLADMVAMWKDWKPDRIVFDPLVSFGIGEARINDAEQALIEAFRILVRRLDCCIDAVHHVGKSNARDGAKDQYAGRGGSALADGARMVAVLTPVASGPLRKATAYVLEPGQSALEISLPKTSYTQPQQSIFVLRDGFEYSHLLRTLSDTAVVMDQAATDDQLVLDFLHAERAAGRIHGKTAFEAIAANPDSTTFRMGRKALRAALARLEASGEITYERIGEGRNTVKGIFV